MQYAKNQLFTCHVSPRFTRASSDAWRVGYFWCSFHLMIMNTAKNYKFTSSVAAFVVASLAVTLGAPVAKGASTITWNGSLGNNIWDASGNWVGGVAPSGASGDTAQFNGTQAGALALIWKGTNSSASPGLVLSVLGTQTSPLSIDGSTNVGLRLQGLFVSPGAGTLTLGNGVGTWGSVSGFNITLNGGFTNNSATAAVVNSDVAFASSGGSTRVLNLWGNWNFHNNLARSTNGTGAIGYGLQSGIMNYDGVSSAFPNSSPINIGSLAGQTAILNFNSGATLVAGGNQPISAGTAGFGVINMVSGSSITPGQFLVAGITTSGAIGIWNISGGAVATSGNNGGTLGATVGTIGQLNLTGTGTYTSTDATANGASGLYVGENGTGTLNISGSATMTLGGASTSAGLNVGRNAGASGIVNLGAVGAGGGTITAVRVQQTGGGATGIFDFHGGTLKASAAANATFFSGLTSAYVYGEGGTIDNNSINISIAQSLQAPDASGVTAISPAASGFTTTGYSTAPLVTITTTGAGMGATAVATVDGSGNLTGFIITNPGRGYQNGDTITATLNGGGAASSSSATAVTLSSNTSGGLTFQGSGTTTLTGANSYTGPTKLQGGTLTLVSGGALAGGDLSASNATFIVDASTGASATANNVTLNAGTVVNVTNNPSAYAINGAGNLAIQSNTVLTLNYGALGGNPTAGGISVAGSISVGGPTNVINILGSGFTAGQFPLIKYGAGTLASISGFKLNLPPGVNATLVNNTANQSLDLNISFIGQALTWSGATNGIVLANWNINGDTNWNSASGQTRYLEYLGNTFGDLVTFDDSLFNDGIQVPATNVILTTTVHPSQITMNNSAYPYVFSGPGSLSGPASLILNGTSTVTLTTSNNYRGGTFINAGTLIVTNDNELGTNSGAVTLNGGAWEIDGNTASARPIAASTAASIGVGGGSTAQLNGVIGGVGALTKSGNGTLVLAANEAYTGNTFVSGGNLTVDTGGVITNGSYDSVGRNGTDNGTLTLRGSGSLTTTSDFNVGDIDSSTGTLNIQDSATLTMNAFFVGSANAAGSTASGTVNQNGGSVTENSTGIGTFAIGGRTSVSGVGVYNMNAGTLTAHGGIRVGGTGTGTLNQNGGTINAIAGINLARISGSFGTNNLNGGILATFNVASSTGTNAVFNFNGGTLLAAFTNANPFMSGLSQANILAGGAIIDDGGNAVNIPQPLLAGSPGGGLTKQGAGTLNLTGANTYTGPTLVNSGQLTITPAHQSSGSVTVANGAIFGISTSSTTNGVSIGNLTLGSTGAATLLFSYGTPGNPTNVALTAAAVTINGGSSIKIGGSFSVGAFPILKYSSLSSIPTVVAPRGMTATLSNDATHTTLYVVVTSIGGGIVWTGTNNVAPNLWDINTTANWLTGATPTTYQETTPPGDAVTFNDSGSGIVLLSNTVDPLGVTISNSAVNYVVQGTGQINSSAGLTKLGSGSVTLSVPGTYSASTVVSNGILSLGANQTFANLAGNGIVTTASGTPGLTITATTNTTFAGSLQGALVVTKTGNGTLTLPGTNTFTGNVFARAGSIVLDSGSVNNGGSYSSIGFNTGDNAILVMKGTAAFTNTADFNVGDVGNSIGTLNLQDSAVASIQNLFVGSANASGATASGAINMNGGTLIEKGGTGNFVVGGRNSGSSSGVGVINLTNGYISATCGIRVGDYGTGTINQFGGLLEVTNSGTGINLHRESTTTSFGTYNLNGGVLRTEKVTTSTAGVNSLFYLNGGTLQAGFGNLGTTPFLNNLAHAFIRNGGAIIDDAGYAIIIAQPLEHSDIGTDNATDGGLTKLGSGAVYLDGNNSYTGITTVSNGVLAGVGSIPGPVFVKGAGKIGAGDAGSTLGTLTMNNNLTIQGGAILRINNNGGTPTSDMIAVSGTANYGGTLVVTNTTSDATALTVGETFTLFTAGTHNGNFASIVSANGGAVYSFANGVLTVMSVGPDLTQNHLTNSVTAGGTTLSLSWSTGWKLQAQTNSLATGLSGSWVTITDGSVTSTNLPMVPGNPSVFYRLINQ